jgi:hypothetical protein
MKIEGGGPVAESQFAGRAIASPSVSVPVTTTMAVSARSAAAGRRRDGLERRGVARIGVTLRICVFLAATASTLRAFFATLLRAGSVGETPRLQQRCSGYQGRRHRVLPPGCAAVA